jgi:hypothetical protein
MPKKRPTWCSSRGASDRFSEERGRKARSTACTGDEDRSVRHSRSADPLAATAEILAKRLYQGMKEGCLTRTPSAKVRGRALVDLLQGLQLRAKAEIALESPHSINLSPNMGSPLFDDSRDASS